MSDYDLSRYLEAQNKDYEVALKEIKEGYKRSHWMWYIFPQILGLGQSRASVLYSIKDINEARAYMEDDTLRTRLIEVCEALLSLETNDASYIFGTPDDMKLRSSMTLFNAATPEVEVFQKVLDKFFAGAPDPRTLEIISWRS